MKLRTKATVAISCLGVLFLGTVSVVAADDVCSKCGPGPNWIDNCEQGTDAVAKQRAIVGIDTDLDCMTDLTVSLFSCGTDLTIRRLPAVPGDPATIATEILDLCLTNGTQALVVGAGLGNNSNLAPSLGSIIERGDNTLGDSTFQVMFEFDLGGGNYVYNHTPLEIASEVECVPPRAWFRATAGCLELYDDPIAGMHVANLIEEDLVHDIGPVPTISEWGVVAMVLLVMAAGTIVIRRFRRVPA